jgi:hypothetical protein
LDFLLPLKKIEMLIIADNLVTDADARVLCEFPRLSYLEIFKNRLTDASIFQKCTALQDLGIGHNYFSDLSPFYECVWLDRLWINQQLSPFINGNAAQELIEKLPYTIVSFDTHGSTGDGWRDHPRYMWQRALLYLPSRQWEKDLRKTQIG